jgi:16S rRNA (guanine527-N7)-methyltransferase
VKHPTSVTTPAAVKPAPPAVAVELFGPALPDLERFVGWLATAGVERGLLGPREVDRLWERHVLNSAALVDWLPDHGRVLDLGSGAGLPGIVLALLRPDLDMVLLEPLLRRATFLEEVVADLRLPRTSVVRARVEDFAIEAPESVDAVVARAVAPLERLIGWAAPLIRIDGWLLALKGESVAKELAPAAFPAAAWGMSAAEIHPVVIGGTVTQVVRLQRVRLQQGQRRKR